MLKHIETKSDYEEYRNRIDKELDGVEAVSSGACPGCEECDLSEIDDMNCEEYELAGEPHFSWRECELCNRPLGGDRYPAHGIIDGEIVHFDVCTDCYYYIEYGRLDDMTMLDIEDSEE